MLLSKFTAGLVYMAITFIPAMIAANIFFKEHFAFLIVGSELNLLGLSTLGIGSSAIWIAVTFIFFWSIFLIYSQRMNDFLSFLITFGLFLLSAYFYDMFVHLPFIQTLTDWGAITVNDVMMGFEFSISREEIQSGAMTETSIFYIGHFVRDTITAILMFIGACWMIDRKVEV